MYSLKQPQCSLLVPKTKESPMNDIEPALYILTVSKKNFIESQNNNVCITLRFGKNDDSSVYLKQITLREQTGHS